MHFVGELSLLDCLKIVAICNNITNFMYNKMYNNYFRTRFTTKYAILSCQNRPNLIKRIPEKKPPSISNFPILPPGTLPLRIDISPPGQRTPSDSCHLDGERKTSVSGSKTAKQKKKKLSQQFQLGRGIARESASKKKKKNAFSFAFPRSRSRFRVRSSGECEAIARVCPPISSLVPCRRWPLPQRSRPISAPR